jgi:hypothetical protein
MTRDIGKQPPIILLVVVFYKVRKQDVSERVDADIFQDFEII